MKNTIEFTEAYIDHIAWVKNTTNGNPQYRDHFSHPKRQRSGANPQLLAVSNKKANAGFAWGLTEKYNHGAGRRATIKVSEGVKNYIVDLQERA